MEGDDGMKKIGLNDNSSFCCALLIRPLKGNVLGKYICSIAYSSGRFRYIYIIIVVFISL